MYEKRKVGVLLYIPFSFHCGGYSNKTQNFNICPHQTLH